MQTSMDRYFARLSAAPCARRNGCRPPPRLLAWSPLCTRRFCRNEQLLKEAMGFSSSQPVAFTRNYDAEVELASSLLRVEQQLQRPSTSAASEATSAAAASAHLLIGKWVPVAPDVASGIITRAAAQKAGQFRSVNL